jgi:hypothetical protein
MYRPGKLTRYAASGFLALASYLGCNGNYDSGNRDNSDLEKIVAAQPASQPAAIPSAETRPALQPVAPVSSMPATTSSPATQLADKYGWMNYYYPPVFRDIGDFKGFLLFPCNYHESQPEIKRKDHPKIPFREGFGGSWMQEYSFDQPVAFYAEVIGKQYKGVRIEVYDPKGKKFDEVSVKLAGSPVNYIGYVFNKGTLERVGEGKYTAKLFVDDKLEGTAELKAMKKLPERKAPASSPFKVYD